ncbi:hypothetical protein VYJ29_003350 [Yersinia enterocolitica]|nr:hypothetical protein [Yersinia enterocolitica]ELI7927423.1 hypothetical protein [Yersinia enterocolitica]ELI7958002.1 hypothetical protein [Yersinia enterocolitica]ELI7980581.1 hypothetical protein [Yersinia enterocolitica]ELI8139958.1 hypothetical protein [Yersinia enterocolitica]
MSKESKSWKITPVMALGLIFITLKLMGYITWSWWWVTAPFWVLPAILIAAAGVVSLIVGAIKLFGGDKS